MDGCCGPMLTTIRSSLRVRCLVGGGDDLVPVLAGDVVDAALGGIGVARRTGRVSGASVTSSDLRSSGGGILAPRYSTGMPPSG